MKKNDGSFHIALFFIVFIFSFISVKAQEEPTEELKLSLQIRPRAEMRNGLFTPILKGLQPAVFVGQRSRLGLVYSKNQHLKIGLSAQVVNTWGNDAQVQITANDLSLYEAWAQLYFSRGWNLKLGRQILSYDDERILGALDWNNAGRKHDAAVLGFEKKKNKANAGLAFNQNTEKTTGTFFDSRASQPYKSMEFLWFRYDINPTIAFSILGLNLGFQDYSDSSRSNLQTLGGNLFLKKSKWKATGTYYLQTGSKKVNNYAGIKTNAWMAALNIDYQVSTKFNTTVGSDYLSGNDMAAASSGNKYFNPLYGTGHKFYGSMDYFYVSSPHRNVGLWDSYLSLNFKPNEKSSGQLAFHHFESAAKMVGYAGETAGRSLGNELDLSFNYSIIPDAKISGGYSQMFADKSMRYAKNISPLSQTKSTQNWVWLSINFNPQIILKSKI